MQTGEQQGPGEGAYHFGTSTLSQRISEKVYRIRSADTFQRIPPADVLFLHRKLAGIYLLLAKISAKVDVKSNIQSVMKNTVEQEPVLQGIS